MIEPTARSQSGGQHAEFFLRNKLSLGETDKIVMIKDLTIRISCIILITICLSIGVMNIVSTTDAAETNMSSRNVENATGHRQNATTLPKQSAAPINDTFWGPILSTIVDSVIDEYNNNAHKANPIGNKSGITLADDLRQIANYFNEYSTSVLAFSTMGLVAVTIYYAKQTRALTRNQLRPYLSVSLEPRQAGQAYEIWLNMLNVGHGAAFDVLVEYSVKGISKSEGTNMTRAIPPQTCHSIQLKKMPESEPLLHHRDANRIIRCKLTYEGTSGSYKQKKSLHEHFAIDDGAIKFVIVTGDDNLRGNGGFGAGCKGSGVTADVLLPGGSSFTVTLKPKNTDEEFASHSTRELVLPIPLKDNNNNPVDLWPTTHRIAGVRINMQQGDYAPPCGSDNWDIASLSISLLTSVPGAPPPTCQLNLVGKCPLPHENSTGLVRLSECAGPSGNGPSWQYIIDGSPDENCPTTHGPSGCL